MSKNNDDQSPVEAKRDDVTRNNDSIPASNADINADEAAGAPSSPSSASITTIHDRSANWLTLAAVLVIATSTLTLSGPLMTNRNTNKILSDRRSSNISNSSGNPSRLSEAVCSFARSFLSWTATQSNNSGGEEKINSRTQCSAPAPSKPQVALPGVSPRELPAPLRLDTPHCQLLQIPPHELPWYVTGRVARTDHIYPNSISFDWANVRIDAALSVTPVGTPFTVSVVLIYPCTDEVHYPQKLHVYVYGDKRLTIYTEASEYADTCNQPTLIGVPSPLFTLPADISIVKATEPSIHAHTDPPDNSVTFVGFYVQALQSREGLPQTLENAVNATLSLSSQAKAIQARTPDVRRAYKRIEWIGASIFCGLQILCMRDGLPLTSALEDSTESYAARTCASLPHTKCSFICRSGEGLARGALRHKEPGLSESYNWLRATSPDREVVHDEDTEPDLVIINVGMNDLRGPYRRLLPQLYVAFIKQIIKKYNNNTNLPIVLQCGPNGYTYCKAMYRATMRTLSTGIAHRIVFHVLPLTPRGSRCYDHPNVEYSKVLTRYMQDFLLEKFGDLELT